MSPGSRRCSSMPSTHGRGELLRLSLDKITTTRVTSGELGRTYRRSSPRRTEPLCLFGGNRGLVDGSVAVLSQHLRGRQFDVVRAGADANDLAPGRPGDPLADRHALACGG